MAKRSPILGYNHNVRYRGLVFHVQTEDSGILSPHLFTHLFHAGVIVSTRKLVYDAGSAEDAIKSLMQAQHKAVLKDLRRGHFDDKIDQYLGGTPGLLPREAVAADASQVLARPSAPEIEITVTAEASEPVDSKISTDPQLGVQPGELAQLEHAGRAHRREHTIPDVRPPPPPPPVQARTKSVPSSLDEVGTVDIPMTAANNATIRTPIPREFIDSAGMPILREDTESPEIEIQLELDDPDEGSGGHRSSRDTDIHALDEHTRPTMDVSQLSDGVPGMVNPALTVRDSTPLGTRAGKETAGRAASLPPARPITRPPTRPAIPAISAPQVVSRPLPPDERGRSASDAVEVYAPAPPSAELQAGDARSAGQYSQHRRQSEKIPLLADARPPPAVPSGLGRPGRGKSGPIPKPVAKESTPSSAVPAPVRPEQTPGSGGRPRTPTPARTSGSRVIPTNPNSSGVVMTRPAVIVGAPAKPAAPARVRKAREDEGRGFGQGLISEKSLDEVILAYLSEDADEK